MPGGGRLLDRVHTITCISGGALPGLTYLLAKARSENLDDSFKQLFRLLVNNGLSNPLLKDFEKSSKNNAGLIESLASVYDNIFFHGAKFGEILDYVSWGGIHHFSVDATDFELGMPFRFQATDRIEDPNRKEPYGVIGNSFHRVDRVLAHDIRLADMMAATSCFPLVFEPFIFPNDFRFENSKLTESLAYSYVLMDGGLVDNQGIDPALHAEEHLRTKECSHDLLLLSDAGNMSSEENQTAISSFKFSPDVWFWIIYSVAILSMIFAIVWHVNNWHFLSGFCCMLFIFLIAVLCLIKSAEERVIRYLCHKAGTANCYSFIWKNAINNILEFLRSRIKTAHRMVDVIMMGHIKRSSYKLLFDNSLLKDKVQLNSLFILSSKGKWNKVLDKMKQPDKSMTPSRRIRQNSDKANQMNTTLWFSDEEKRTKMPEAILACGQYTICWNLLQRIDRWKALPNDQLSDGMREMMAIEGILKGDWKRFNINPTHMAVSFSSRED